MAFYARCDRCCKVNIPVDDLKVHIDSNRVHPPHLVYRLTQGGSMCTEALRTIDPQTLEIRRDKKTGAWSPVDPHWIPKHSRSPDADIRIACYHKPLCPACLVEVIKDELGHIK